MHYLNTQLTDRQSGSFLLLYICQLEDAMGIAPCTLIVWTMLDVVQAERQLPCCHQWIMSPVLAQHQFADLGKDCMLHLNVHKLSGLQLCSACSTVHSCSCSMPWVMLCGVMLCVLLGELLFLRH